MDWLTLLLGALAVWMGFSLILGLVALLFDWLFEDF